MDNEGKPTNPANQATRPQHENKIKAFHNFMTAVRSGTFNGVQAIHIAALLNLLEQEYAQAIKDYEAAASTHPEWGIKPPSPTAPMPAGVS